MRMELLLVLEEDGLISPFSGNTFRKEQWMGFKANDSVYNWLSNVKEQQWLRTCYEDIGNFGQSG